MKEYFTWLAKLLTLIGVLLFVVPFVLITLIAAAATVVSNKDGDPKKMVAVVELNGEIMKSREVLERLDVQIKDKNVKGVILSINSPGGAVGPSQEIYSAVKKWKAKKPIVAVMGSVAASGGFYSAIPASKVYCQPGTLTGSIGVIMQVPNLRRIADWAGFSMITIKSGAMKDVGNSFRDMTPEEQAFLENTVARVHQDFIDAIVESRGISLEKVREFADGRVILGSQAKELGLVDGYGDIYDAGRVIFDILGEPLAESEEPTLFYPEDRFDQFKKALEAVTMIPRMLTSHAELMYLMP